MPVFRDVNLIWTGLSFPKCAACGNFGHVLSGCKSGEKNSGQGLKRRRFLCFNSDKRHFVLIYAKKQAPIFHLVSFNGVTWASVVSGSPKNLFSTVLVENNLSIGSVDSSMPAIMILALHVADISCKLDWLLAVLSANSAVPPTPKHNPMLKMAVDTLLFIPPVSSVVIAISQEIFPSGACVLTVKIDGLETNLAVLENLVKAILNKLDSFGSGSSMITLSLPQ
ncbi:hypothetical protein G9A89_007207 [Geosiphon pyriformis]|nr:hypothetical protein G9A89_007207 [Geosiphon pyriformis]